MNSQENSPEKMPAATDTSGALTPHDIVEKQIRDFDYHVTDEDLARMVVSDHAPEEQTRASEEADALEGDRTGTSLDVLENS